MTKAIRISERGGPEVLQLVDYDPGPPGVGQVLLRQYAAGVNLIDIYHRESETGQYAIPLPATLGVEGAGVVEVVGPGVEGIAQGDRVAYLMALGAYAERRIINASSLIPLPEEISFQQAASLMVKGCTAQYLLHKMWKVGAGDTILVHAAAGGVGSILSRWASQLGARVIGIVGSKGKLQAARDAGAAEVINASALDFAEEVRRMTDGRGVDVVYDSVGADSFDRSITCLRPLGMLVSYGQASGPVSALDISQLATNGSIFLAKPTLATFTRDPGLLGEMATGLFDAVKAGVVSSGSLNTVALSDVPDVHQSIQRRETVGATVIRFDVN